VTTAESRTRWFAWALAAVALGALALRVTYVLVERRNWFPGFGDALFYHASANLLAEGKGFVSPFFYPARRVQAAEHPPLYIVFLAVPSLLGMKSVLTHLLWSCLLGCGTVVLVGLLGRAIADEWVGITAAVIAAVYPNIWAPDGMLQAETLAIFTTTLALLLAYRYCRKPSWPRLVLLGVVCGAAALTRSELVLLVPLVVAPLALLTRERSPRERLVWFGAAAVAALLVIAPWTAYNASRFEHPIVLSAQIDPLLASANCDSTYYGPLFQGYFDIECAKKIADREEFTIHDDESQQAIAYRHAAVAYVRANLGRVPTVEAVRLLRIVGLYHPSRYVRLDSYVEGRELWISWAALYSFYAMAILAAAGVIVRLRRRRASPDPSPLFPLLAPFVVVVITVLTTYASTRFRAAAEPSLAVLSAVAINAAIARMRGGRGRLPAG
jgi:4-amino-4-deoxy-L-arabinose transferase-like glycosyltransferase